MTTDLCDAATALTETTFVRHLTVVLLSNSLAVCAGSICAQSRTPLGRKNSNGAWPRVGYSSLLISPKMGWSAIKKARYQSTQRARSSLSTYSRRSAAPGHAFGLRVRRRPKGVASLSGAPWRRGKLSQVVARIEGRFLKFF